MGKVQRIFERTHTLNFFSPWDEFQLYRTSFLQSTLGRIYQQVPWKELIRTFELKDNHRGPDSIFSSKGKLALMFLKAYTEFSDRKLVESINGNIYYQMFCEILIPPGEKLTDFKIVSRIRTELGKKLDIAACQRALAQAWKPRMSQTHVVMTDATCYESHMRYPTNIKLLWESVDWLHHQMSMICKYSKIRMPRSKYLDQRKKYFNYQRKRKKVHKDTTPRTRSLLKLLLKMNGMMDKLENELSENLHMPVRYYQQRKVIRTVYQQQMEMFLTGKSLPGRIVSLSKSYIRPIVRGKEVKPVEFGAKVNTIQIDGINFIEHFSFDPFNEGTRLKPSIRLARELFGVITHVAADAIYATNANRCYCSENHITTNFVRKGRAGKYEDQRKKISTVLNRERATRMEGSFGTEKEHYGLKRIRARIQLNEMLWVFFGIHTANLVRLANRMKENQKQKAA